VKFAELKPFQYALVFLYDPIPLEKVSLDLLKSQFSDGAAYSADEKVVVGGSTEEGRRVQIQTARLEYTKDNPESFVANLTAPIETVLGALPPLAIKALGINLFLRGVGKGVEPPTVASSLMLFGEVDTVQRKLSGKLIATAQRVLYGDSKEYFDLRVTPLGLAENTLQIQLHKHKDLDISDTKRILQETAEAHRQTIVELARLQEIL
jgi:hypothetical protein